MRHADVQTATHYAATDYGRREMGSSSLEHIVVVDTAKDYAWNRERGVYRVAKPGQGRMHVQVIGKDGVTVVREGTTIPAKIMGLWSEHEEAAKRNREHKAAMDARQAEAKARRDALNARLANHPALGIPENNYGSGWAVRADALEHLLDHLDAHPFA